MISFISKHQNTLLLALALSTWFFRFYDLDYSPYYGDEAALQTILEEHIDQGTFPFQGLMGTKGVRYGPSGLWFYYPLRLFTNEVAYFKIYFAFSMFIGFIFISLSVGRVYGIHSAVWMFFLLSTNPFSIHFSRTCWDNPLLFFTSSTCVFLFVSLIEWQENRFVLLKSILLGIFLGFCLGVHLLSLPFLAAVFVSCLFFFKKIKSYKLASLIVIAFIITSLPYLISLSPLFLGQVKGTPDPHPYTLSVFFNSFLDGFLAPTFYFSTKSMSYFLDGSLSTIRKNMGFIPGLFVEIDLTWIFRAFAYLSMTKIVYNLSRGQKQNALEFLSIALFFIYLLFFILARPPLGQPHYFIITYWLGFYWLIKYMNSLNTLRAFVLKLFILFYAFINVYFYYGLHMQIEENLGTKGIHFGTVPIEVKRAVREMCTLLVQAQNENAILDLSAIQSVDHTAVKFYFSHEKKCKDKRLGFRYPLMHLELKQGKEFKFVHTENSNSAGFEVLNLGVFNYNDAQKNENK